MLRISVDMDGVLINLMEEFCRLYNCMYNEEKTLDDISCWDFFRKWDLTEAQTYKMFETIEIKNIPVIDSNACLYMNELQGFSRVDIVTARRESTRSNIEAKLLAMKITTPECYRELKIVPYFPADAKLNFNYDIYIDDSENLAESIKKKSNTFLFLWSQPWNSRVKEAINVKRVNGWKDILKILKIKNKNKPFHERISNESCYKCPFKLYMSNDVRCSVHHLSLYETDNNDFKCLFKGNSQNAFVKILKNKNDNQNA